MVAPVLPDGSLGPAVQVAGGTDEAVQQPFWAADGTALYYISDRTNWGNLYRWDYSSTAPAEANRPQVGWGRSGRMSRSAAGAWGACMCLWQFNYSLAGPGLGTWRG